MGKKGRRNHTYESTGQDRRSSSELEAEIARVQAAPEPESSGPTPPVAPEEPVTQPEPEPSPEPPERPTESEAGFDLEYPEPSAKAEEPETDRLNPEQRADFERQPGRWKSEDTYLRSHAEAQSALSRKETEARQKESELAELRERLARLEGFTQAALAPEPEPTQPPEPELTDDQMRDWMLENPRAFVDMVRHKAMAEVRGDIESLKEEREVDRTRSLIQERAQFAITQIPELKALHESGGDYSKVDPDYGVFATKLTETIRRYPDLAADNDKMLLAADAVRMEMYRDKMTAKQTPSPGRPPASKPSTQGDVFLESATGNARTAERKKTISEMTASEMERELGIPTAAREGY